MSEEVTPQEVAPEEVVPQEETPEVVLPSDVEDFVMPEKFEGKSAEDIAKAYAELEKLQSKKEEPTSEEPESDDVATKQVTKELLDEYVDKARENGGELSEEHYAELESKGYSKDVVDVYAKGVQAQEAENARQILDTAGTNADDFNKAAEWARDNWPAEKVERVNKVLGSTTGDALITAIESLMSDYNRREVTPEPNLHAGGQGTPPQRGYANESEMIRDMQDPRYTSDKAFNAAVTKKLQATTAF